MSKQRVTSAFVLASIFCSLAGLLFGLWQQAAAAGVWMFVLTFPPFVNLFLYGLKNVES